jgi:hypothetical protein
MAPELGVCRDVTTHRNRQVTPVLRAAHGEQREHVTSSQIVTDDLGVMRTIAEMQPG